MEAAGDRIYQTIVERTDDHRQSELFARIEPGILEAAKRYDMAEVEQSWSDQTAIVQSIRCFQCDSVHHYDQTVCVLCGACDDVCPEKAIDVVVFGEDRERSSGGDTLVCATSGGTPRRRWLRGRDLHQLRPLHELQDLRGPLPGELHHVRARALRR